MHVLITDSGVGGLSVCAYAERLARTHNLGVDVRLTYVNAAPENDFGYNSMGSRQEKLAQFDRFLSIVSRTYAPDMIYIACNTLSVLFPDTSFSKSSRLPVRGIVDTGAARLKSALLDAPRAMAVIFGTPTTIDENTYATRLIQTGIAESRIISQSCPGLADIISEDRQGKTASREIEKCVANALKNREPDRNSFIVYLACTHYGYRKELFASAFEDRGCGVRILNPNELVLDDLFGQKDHKPLKGPSNVEVAFVTRYRIPETALETISYFLNDVSPKTVRAFEQYTFAPQLF